MKAENFNHTGEGNFTVEFTYEEICKVGSALKLAKKFNPEFEALFCVFNAMKYGYSRYVPNAKEVIDSPTNTLKI